VKLWLTLWALAALLLGLGWGLWGFAQRQHQRQQLYLRLRQGEEAVVVPSQRWQATVAVLQRAGVKISAGKVSLLGVALLAMLAVSLSVFSWVGLALWLAVCALLALAVLRQAAQRRALMVEQLPSFLESLLRILSTGRTLEDALTTAVQHTPEPLNEVFIAVARQVRLGANLEDVLTEAAHFYRLRELHTFALAARINRQYGGSLRHILGSLSEGIYSRLLAKRELRALSAETRLSAWVLALIPVVLVTWIYSQNQAYYQPMLANVSGQVLLSVSVLLEVTGVFLMLRLLQPDEDT
jgi:tight adherence protein B